MLQTAKTVIGEEVRYLLGGHVNSDPISALEFLNKVAARSTDKGVAMGEHFEGSLEMAKYQWQTKPVFQAVPKSVVGMIGAFVYINQERVESGALSIEGLKAELENLKKVLEWSGTALEKSTPVSIEKTADGTEIIVPKI